MNNKLLTNKQKMQKQKDNARADGEVRGNESDLTFITLSGLIHSPGHPLNDTFTEANQPIRDQLEERAG